MDIISIILIALSLAMDAFAVSITAGLTIEKNHLAHGIRIALYFGFFQAIMPLLGWLLASALGDLVSAYQHYIAFIILVIIGIKMIADSRKACTIPKNFASHKTLLLLAIATSIDAFAAGVSFRFIDISIIQPVIIIGVITFITSLAGVYTGKVTGCILKSYADILGGIILLIIAIKILLTG
ncbi:MAG: manganese efflux pump MntP family protein [Candidatus Electryonea clarkiae]|nr:manganese efflux pump MntP family protein [Candidatus Stygibacter australis]MDP8285412.1 manganese efflux pump MntP family protein [Candidatus Electryonea clarkiae]